MKRTWIAVAAFALAGCGVGSDDPPSGDPKDTVAPDPSTSEVVDAVSGKPLSEFEGSADYEWRKAIAEDPDAIVQQMQAIAPHLDEQDLSGLLETCGSASGGEADDQLADAAVDLFSGGPGEEVSPDQATALVGLARTDVCP
ncbi:hypothetical protein [Nocardioides zeicaulis]|uniref:DUF732 domain-containing protein n=1 Tax=Nocardioides zeicaulis TaxID=1776857 RepID=A0ABV6E6I3_9ACTN